jgi:hypothetical protein
MRIPPSILKPASAVLAIVTFSVMSFCQDNSKPAVIVYEPFKPSVDTIVPVSVKNCIKWNWSMATRGVFLCNYERKVASFLSIEPGIGITHADYLYELSSGVGYLFERGTRVNPGYAADCNIRMYPRANLNMRGFYLAAGTRFRQYVMTDTYNKNVNYHFQEHYLLAGFQDETKRDNVYDEFYLGICIKQATYTSRKPLYTDHSEPRVYVYNEKTVAFPYIMCGYKIGLGF